MITLLFTYQDKDYEYQIAGFFETTMMGTNNIGVMKFMLPETSYQALADELDNQSKGLIISAVMEDQTQSPKLQNDFIQECSAINSKGNDFIYLGIRY